LPFFPRSSRAYVEAMLSSGGDERRALVAAEKEFKANRYSIVPGEAEDPYVQQVFGNANPLDPGYPLSRAAGLPDDSSTIQTFAAIAWAVFEPLLRHQEEGTSP
jgi:hypothetical protein